MRKYFLGFIVSLTTLSAVNALAFPLPSANDSWESIQAQVADYPALSIDQPNMNVAAAFGSKGFFNACVDGNNLRSLTPEAVCLEGAWVPLHNNNRNDDEQFVCYKSATQYIVVPMQQTSEQCAAFKVVKGQYHDGDETVCVGYATTSYTLSANPMFSVTKLVGANDDGRHDNEGNEEVLFSKTYNIPSCK